MIEAINQEYPSLPFPKELIYIEMHSITYIQAMTFKKNKLCVSPNPSVEALHGILYYHNVIMCPEILLIFSFMRCKVFFPLTAVIELYYKKSTIQCMCSIVRFVMKIF